MKQTHSSKFSPCLKPCLRAISLIAGLLAGGSVFAAPFTWNGAAPGVNRNWTTALNWVGGTAPDPANQDDIIMDGSTKLSNRANSSFGVGWDINSLTFTATAGAFVISGFSVEEIFIGGGILNSSANIQTVNHHILIGASQSFDAGSAAGGGLVIGGTVDLFSSTLTVTGALNNNTTLGNIVSGSGSIIKTGAGTLTLNGANNFAGGVTLAAGTIETGNDAALGGGTFNLNGGTLKNTSGARVLGNSIIAGGGAISLINNLTGTSLIINNAGGLSASKITLHPLSATTHNVLTFDSGNFVAGKLDVENWQGTANATTTPSPGTGDRIFINNAVGADFLAAINFVGNYAQGAVRLDGGEIVPVPEPTAILASLGLMGFAAWRFYGKRKDASLPTA